MSRTGEQLAAARELADAARGYRVVVDADGWPIVRGRYGRLEHLGASQLAAFTDRRLIRSPLLAIEGVTKQQVGDRELRVQVTAAAIPAVARLLRCYRQRVGGAAHLVKHAFKSTLTPPDEPGAVQ